jgi:hypothetical protein
MVRQLQLQATYSDPTSGFTFVSEYFICSRQAIDGVKVIIWGIAYSPTIENARWPERLQVGGDCLEDGLQKGASGDERSIGYAGS